MNKPATSFYLVAVVLTTGLSGACAPPDQPERRQSVSARLSDDASLYKQVITPRALRFPDDHGPHPRYKHEWWYLTGQVATTGGRPFGFQFTIFREAVSPGRIESPSRWATSQLYMAHAAVTDIEGERYLSDERYARGALELAGARAAPFRVWLEDWELAGDAGPDGVLSARVTARARDFELELEFSNSRPPVAHGDRGLSVKGAAGNASYYYSYTRLKTRGTVRVGNTSFDTAGEAWFDHEWSSSALKADQSGWDWFSLQLSSGAELMAFRLRHRNDAARDFYSGTYVAPSGERVGLEDGQISMQTLDHWTSERTGIRYPRRWRVRVPDLALTLITEPWLDDQEFAHGFRYWEGAVRVSGDQAGEKVDGRGYVELAGYGSAAER